MQELFQIFILKNLFIRLVESAITFSLKITNRLLSALMFWFHKMSYEALPDSTVPEMQRTNVTWMVLQLKALGIDDILHFDFISPPSAEVRMHELQLNRRDNLNFHLPFLSYHFQLSFQIVDQHHPDSLVLSPSERCILISDLTPIHAVPY